MSQTISIDRFLTKSEAWVPVAPDGQYKQITARLWGKGLTLRGEVPGAAIAAPRQFCAKAGQFLISRIDARHGAFGIVPGELDGALVSNDFPCFDIDASTVLPHYFEWYSRTPAFVDLCRRASEGSTNRVRLKEEKFLKMTVPLASLEEQRGIVARLDRVSSLVEEAKSLRAKIRVDATKLLERLHFDLAERQEQPLGDFILLSEDRVALISDHDYPQVGIRGFAGGLFFKDATAGSDTSYKSFNRLRPDLLVVSQPKGWEGAVAVTTQEHDGWFASPEYRTFRCRDGMLIPSYLRQFIATEWFQAELRKLTRGQGARRERLRPDMLLGMPVCMPSITDQYKALMIHEKVQRLRSITEPTSNEIESLVPSMLDEIFNGKAAAA
ncbi:MAG: restriction endonuclease subunit S [Rhodobacteraceae bacterium]|nr:restriction endonuclease subunit S [Paracoccaceae bacterium]